MATAKKPTTATKKKTTTKKVARKTKLDNKNVKETVAKIVKSTREIKYNYPSKVKQPLERKQWRQKVRNTIRKYERDLAKLKGAAKIKLNKEYKVYRSEVLLVP